MEIGEIADIVEQCFFPEYRFAVWRGREGFMYLQAEYSEPDAVTGKCEMQHTRLWLLSPEATKSEIVQTVFKCVLTSMEHRTREWFRYKGAAVFGPHFDVDALLEICRSPSDVRKIG